MKGMKFQGGTSYNELKERIHRKLGLQGSQCIHRMTARLETLVDKDTIYYIRNEISDDEDLEFVTDAFIGGKVLKYIEIYVEVGPSQSSTLPTHTSPPQYFGQEDTVVSLSAPAQVLSQMELVDDEDDEEEDVGSDEEGEPESNIPPGDTSDTDVEGDFDAEPNATNLGSPAMSPLQVDPISSDVAPVVEPFWNDNPHWTFINWAHPNEELEMVYGDDDLHGSWKLGDPLYLYQEFDTKAEMQHAVKLYCMKERRTAVVTKSDEHRFVMMCRHSGDGCPWYMRATMPKNAIAWVIRKWGPEHTCLNQGLERDHRQLDSEVICTAILSRFFRNVI